MSCPGRSILQNSNINNFSNSANNNLNFSNKTLPQIHIYTEFIESQQIVIIKIQDNGIGIPNHIQHRIFDPFFTTKQVGKGTGLGMSTSYEIITKKHQGTLELTSNPEDSTCFIIGIPIKQERT